jgi:Zn-dependent peptidase ImmA (M78 family)
VYPEDYAREILTELRIASFPIDPFFITKEFDIEVFEADADSYDGFLLRNESSTKIYINKNIASEGRKKFTLAHEIGHYCIPTHRGNYQCIRRYLNPFRKKPEVEMEANKFASELLLPENLLKPILHTYKPDFESINELAEDCGTSLTATAIKFASLSDDCCVLIAMSDNRIKWFQKSPSFPYEYYIEVGKSVSYGTLTASYSLDGILKEPETQKVHASFWFNGRGIDNTTTIIESCVPMPYYGVVLTMLWFPAAPFDSQDYSDADDEYRYEADENTWRWRDPEE